MYIFSEIFTKEIQFIKNLLKQISVKNYEIALEMIETCKGKTILTGIGKSGHIASKIAATMASTGTPAFFVHPGEACHGDLGMIETEDLIIAISHSGESSEIMTILPICKRRGIKIVTITANPNSSMAKIADIHLCTYGTEEAGPLNLAPTSSTTSTLVLGDALAIAISSRKCFTKEDFAMSHPGGALGKRLLIKNENIMVTGERIPVVKVTDTISNAIIEMTEKKLGFTAVVDASNILYGIFTDGDLRRILGESIDLNETLIDDVITKGCHTVRQEGMAVDSLKLMQEYSINNLIVVDSDNYIIGAFDLHQIIDLGIR